MFKKIVKSKYIEPHALAFLAMAAVFIDIALCLYFCVKNVTKEEPPRFLIGFICLIAMFPLYKRYIMNEKWKEVSESKPQIINKTISVILTILYFVAAATVVVILPDGM